MAAKRPDQALQQFFAGISDPDQRKGAQPVGLSFCSAGPLQQFFRFCGPAYRSAKGATADMADETKGESATGYVPNPALAEIDRKERELRAAGIEPKSVDYGESFVDMNASSEKTPEEIANEGRAIFAKITKLRAAGLDLKDEGRVEKLRKDLQRDHPEFSEGFPIPFRWMVETGDFEPEVFRRWLVQTQTKKMWDSRNAWLEGQAIYLTRLYKHRNPRASSAETREFTRRTQKALIDEEREYKRSVEEAEAEVEREKAEAVEDLRRRLSAFCSSRSTEQLSTHLHRMARGDPGREGALRSAGSLPPRTADPDPPTGS